MLRISRLAAYAALGCLLAISVGASSARADVIKIFDLSGTFSDGSPFGGTMSVDVTIGSLTGIDATAVGVEFKTVSSQRSDGDEGYFIEAASSGDPDAQLGLFILLHSLVNYSGGNFQNNSHASAGGPFFSLSGGRATPAPTPVPEPSSWVLMIMGFAGVSLFAARGVGKVTAAVKI
jgi:hypothetical protein